MTTHDDTNLTEPKRGISPLVAGLHLWYRLRKREETYKDPFSYGQCAAERGQDVDAFLSFAKFQEKLVRDFHASMNIPSPLLEGPSNFHGGKTR